MENNTCTGIALGSFGSNIANYNFWSGYTQHVYMGRNSIQHVWGSDREVMTFDPCAGAYVANVSSVSGSRPQARSQPRAHHPLQSWNSWPLSWPLAGCSRGWCT
jgi:hypothetical protein